MLYVEINCIDNIKINGKIESDNYSKLVDCIRNNKIFNLSDYLSDIYINNEKNYDNIYVQSDKIICYYTCNNIINYTKRLVEDIK